MEHLRCVVERITYQNAENGYSVIKYQAKGYQDLVNWYLWRGQRLDRYQFIFYAQKRPPIGLTGGLKCNFTMLLLYAEIRLG